MKLKQQANGFLTLMAVFIVVILGILSSAVIYLFVSKVSAVKHIMSQPKAFALANTGLEQGLYAISSPDVLNSSHAHCDTYQFTGSLGNGSYTAQKTSTNYPANPLFSSGTLSSAVTTASTSLSFISTNIFAPQGRVMIDREIIDYKQKNGNTLTELTRGVNGTLISSHISGAVASQHLCGMQGIGQFPSGAPASQRAMEQNLPLSMAYAVGDNMTFLQFNHPIDEFHWRIAQPNTGPTQNRRFWAISLLNAHEGWAVGERTRVGSRQRLTISELHNGQWTNYTLSLDTPAQNHPHLYGVTAVSSEEAWAVGNRQGSEWGMFRWYNNNWCRVLRNGSRCNTSITSAINSNGQKRLEGVKVVTYQNDGLGDFGFAVGGSNTVGIILDYQSGNWGDSLRNNTNFGRFHAIDIIHNGNQQPIEAFAVGRARSGSQGRIVRYFNGTWQTGNSQFERTNRRLRGVSMLDETGDGLADFGVAVGDRGNVYIYNAGSWTRFTSGPFGTRGLYDVTVVARNNIWVVGVGGRRWHFDGTSWTETREDSTQNLRGVDAVGPRQIHSIGFKSIATP